MSHDKRLFRIGRLILWFLLGLTVFAFALFLGLPSYQLATASLLLDRALREAQSVTITELVQYFDTSGRELEPRYRVLSSMIPSPEQVEELRRATSGVITIGFPLRQKRCFDPHHRVEIVRADGSFLRLEICFECDNFRFDDGPIQTMPRSWLQRLPTVFGHVGILIRGREEYAKLNPNSA
jgi:hypothetical protein